MRVADIADLTDYQIEALYAAPAAEREAAASGSRSSALDSMDARRVRASAMA